MKPITLALITFFSGSLVTGGTLGTFAYLKIDDLHQQKSHLEKKLNTQKKRYLKLKKNKTQLIDEFEGFKKQKSLEFQQTMGKLTDSQKSGGTEALFNLGMKAYQEKDFPRAYFALSEVKRRNPKYKDIKSNVLKASQAYKRHKTALLDKEIQSTYLKAFDHQGLKQLAQAKALYQKVESLKPNYRDTKKRLNLVTKQLAMRTKKSDIEQEKAWLHSQYKIGLDYQAKGNYVKAKNEYEEIIKFAPKYKDVSKRLVQVISQLPPAPRKGNPITKKVAGPSCYDKGVEYGKCYDLLNKGQRCSHIDVSTPPKECQNNKEFKKGFQTTAPTGTSVILRGLSNFLKKM